MTEVTERIIVRHKKHIIKKYIDRRARLKGMGNIVYLDDLFFFRLHFYYVPKRKKRRKTWRQLTRMYLYNIKRYSKFKWFLIGPTKSEKKLVTELQEWFNSYAIFLYGIMLSMLVYICYKYIFIV